MVEHLALITSSSSLEQVPGTGVAFILFVTHFSDLCRLSCMYPNIRNMHMLTETGNEAEGQDGLHYSHQLHDGPSDLKVGYGIAMASCLFPSTVISRAKQVLELLQTRSVEYLVQATDNDNTDDDDNDNVGNGNNNLCHRKTERLYMLAALHRLKGLTGVTLRNALSKLAGESASRKKNEQNLVIKTATLTNTEATARSTSTALTWQQDFTDDNDEQKYGELSLSLGDKCDMPTASIGGLLQQPSDFQLSTLTPLTISVNRPEEEHDITKSLSSLTADSVILVTGCTSKPTTQQSSFSLIIEMQRSLSNSKKKKKKKSEQTNDIEESKLVLNRMRDIDLSDNRKKIRTESSV